jgi:Putative zinc-finger
VPDHPDHEQLAAFQAGDGDRRQRAQVEAHLAGCPSCAEVVASVEQARSQLALLEEPTLPPGLHDRLAAAVDAAAAHPAVDGPARWHRRQATERFHAHPASEPHPASDRQGRAAERPGARTIPWYRRPVAWGAAAALLLAALVVPFLDRSSGNLTTTSGGSGSAQEAATTAASPPIFRIPGEVSAATVRSRLASDSRAKAALDSATGAAAPAGTPSASQGASGAARSPDQADRSFGSGAPAPQAAPADLGRCLPAATADADPATRPLRPAFFIEGTYQGRAATILVTSSMGQPGRVDLWVFPRDVCSSAPLATERVQ